ncbi:GGDEF domain-containing protein [Methylophaga lonarensis]|uniref:GGDEF domain-containing protein n=1 Tax=Methylophaga lonarensis TaxID=999151 RepID=UPI003D27DA64
MSSVTRAEASAETCGAEIALTEHMLDDCKDMEQLRTIIASVAETTHQLSRTSQQLKDELHESNNEIMKLREELNLVKKAATTDSLTDLLNRGAFDQRLTECLLNQREIAVLLFDIDHFKTVNDTHGHLLGDAVLQYFAKILKKYAANTHVAARFGGEEMAMILFDCDKNEASAIAESILEKFSTSRLKKKNTNQSIGKITASAGLTCLIEGDTTETLLERADNALYRSKNNGRNQVSIE